MNSIIFSSILAAAGITEPVEAEYLFAHPRKWRFDFAFPAVRVAVEIEGGIWANGRHSRPLGMLGDIEKYNEAARLGWVVLRAVQAGADTREKRGASVEIASADFLQLLSQLISSRK